MRALVLSVKMQNIFKLNPKQKEKNYKWSHWYVIFTWWAQAKETDLNSNSYSHICDCCDSHPFLTSDSGFQVCLSIGKPSVEIDSIGRYTLIILIIRSALGIISSSNSKMKFALNTNFLSKPGPVFSCEGTRSSRFDNQFSEQRWQYRFFFF